MNCLLIALVLFAADIKTETHSSMTFGGPQAIQPLDGTLKSTESPVTVTLSVGDKTYDLAGALQFFSRIATHDEIQRWLDGSLVDSRFDIADVRVKQTLTVAFTPNDSQKTTSVAVDLFLTGPASMLGVLKGALKTGIEKAKADVRRLLTKPSTPKTKKKK